MVQDKNLPINFLNFSETSITPFRMELTHLKAKKKKKKKDQSYSSLTQGHIFLRQGRQKLLPGNEWG